MVKNFRPADIMQIHQIVSNINGIAIVFNKGRPKATTHDGFNSQACTQHIKDRVGPIQEGKMGPMVTFVKNQYQIKSLRQQDPLT